MMSTVLYYNDLGTGGTSDKEYRIQIEFMKKGQWNKAPKAEGYVVLFQFGRRGGTLQSGTKTDTPVSLEDAKLIFDGLYSEKFKKGYRPPVDNRAPAEVKNDPAALEAAIAGSMSPQGVVVPDAGHTQYPVELLDELTREEAERTLLSPIYWLQVKVDGHRRQVEKKPDGSIVSYNRNGEAVPLVREVADELVDLPAPTFLLDGELVGSNYVAFDLLAYAGQNYIAGRPYSARFMQLENLIGNRSKRVTVVQTWKSRAGKQGGLALLVENRAEGAVFKNIEARYCAGRNGQHKKFKFLKSASCKVTAIGQGGKANATLALRDGKTWVEVGRVSTNGKGQISVGQVVEVIFLYATEGKRLYQPRIKEVRTDVSPNQCTLDQLVKTYKEGVAA